MADIKTPEERSRNMAAIKGKNTGPEIYLRKELFARGYRYRITPTHIEGHPDLYFSRYHAALFVHGCFWHRHKDCRYSYTPKSRTEFWKKKFDANVHRDEIVKGRLQEENIRVLVVWECAIRKARKKAWSEESLFHAIESFLKSEDTYIEISENYIASLLEQETI